MVEPSKQIFQLIAITPERSSRDSSEHVKRAKKEVLIEKELLYSHQELVDFLRFDKSKVVNFIGIKCKKVRARPGEFEF